MDPRQAKRSASILFVLTFGFWTCMYSFMSHVVPELERMGTAATLIGVISGIYGFTQLAMRIPLGVISGKLGRQKLFITMGCALCALANLGMFCFYSPVGFLICRVISGLAASTWVSFTVLYGSYFDTKDAPRRITLLNAVNQSGQLTGALIAATVASMLSPRAALAVGFVVGVIALTMTFFLQEERAVGKTLQLRDLPVVARNRQLLVCSGLALLFYLISQSTCQSFTATLATALGATSAQIPLLNIISGITIVIGNLVSVRWLLPRFGARKLVSVAFLSTALYCVLSQAATRLWMLFAVQPLIGICNSFGSSVLLGQCIRDVEPRMRSAAMGFFQAVYGAGMAFGPVLMGAMIDVSSITAGYLLMTALALLGMVLALRLMRDKLNVPS